MKGRLARSWPLWSILVAQAVLTVPWLWRTGALPSEAAYAQAGSQAWQHLLDHVGLPSSDDAMPGAPMLYPLLAGALYHVGGLTAARTLSLVAMLAATALVFAIGWRLFGGLAGSLGALLFAVSGLDVHFGALATPGPLALSLVLLATWSAVRATDGAFGWQLGCVTALAAANAVSYPTLAWAPVVLGIAALHGWTRTRWQAIGRIASVAVTWAVLDLGLLVLGGQAFAQGVALALAGQPSQPPAHSAVSILVRTLLLTGCLIVPAVLGVLVGLAVRVPAAVTVLQCLLCIGGLLAPVAREQLFELDPLAQLMVLGLPFAAIGAGFALAIGWQALGEQRPGGRLAVAVMAVGLVLATLILGRLSPVQFRGAPVAVATPGGFGQHAGAGR